VITGVVLAAGSSSRLGRPKQLLDLAGRPVLQHVVDAAEAAQLEEIVVVLGHAADDVRLAIRMGPVTRVAVNPEHARGQSTSLRTGLRATDPASRAALILLGDQPGVRREAIGAVVRAWRSADPGPAVVQAAYGGRAAHPTLFARPVWPVLEAATGDQGARGILAKHPEWRLLVEVGGAPPEDIDTEADYRRIRAAWDAG
jgi:CTP:molybdopterin cytidylyltransferase MocA